MAIQVIVAQVMVASDGGSGGSGPSDGTHNPGSGGSATAPPPPQNMPANSGQERVNLAAPQSNPSRVRAQIDPHAIGLQDADEYQIMVEFSEQTLPQQAVPAGTRSASGRDATRQIEERSHNAIAAAMSTIKSMALQTDAMRKGIPGGSQPRMVKVKFGINLDFEVGAFLAKSGVGATMEVELEWARRSDDVLRVLKADTDVDGALFTDAD